MSAFFQTPSQLPQTPTSGRYYPKGPLSARQARVVDRVRGKLVAPLRDASNAEILKNCYRAVICPFVMKALDDEAVKTGIPYTRVQNCAQVVSQWCHINPNMGLITRQQGITAMKREDELRGKYVFCERHYQDMWRLFMRVGYIVRPTSIHPAASGRKDELFEVFQFVTRNFGEKRQAERLARHRADAATRQAWKRRQGAAKVAVHGSQHGQIEKPEQKQARPALVTTAKALSAARPSPAVSQDRLGKIFKEKSIPPVPGGLTSLEKISPKPALSSAQGRRTQVPSRPQVLAGRPGLSATCRSPRTPTATGIRPTVPPMPPAKAGTWEIEPWRKYLPTQGAPTVPQPAATPRPRPQLQAVARPPANRPTAGRTPPPGGTRAGPKPDGEVAGWTSLGGLAKAFAEPQTQAALVAKARQLPMDATPPPSPAEQPACDDETMAFVMGLAAKYGPQAQARYDADQVAAAEAARRAPPRPVCLPCPPPAGGRPGPVAVAPAPLHAGPLARAHEVRQAFEPLAVSGALPAELGSLHAPWWHMLARNHPMPAAAWQDVAVRIGKQLASGEKIRSFKGYVTACVKEEHARYAAIKT